MLMFHPFCFISSASEAYGDILDHEKFRVMIRSNGKVTYYTAGKTETACVLDLTFYPFDVQSCYIQIDSWTYPESKVKLTNLSSEINVRFYRPNGQWELTATKVIVERDSFEMTFAKLLFVLYLRRKPLFYGMVLVIPITILSFLMVLAFMLPAESGEKIGLEMTVILSMTVFQLLIAENVPDTSDYVPIMGKSIRCASHTHTHTHAHTHTHTHAHTHTHTHTWVSPSDVLQIQ